MNLERALGARSGLRPASAFFLVGVVLALVATAATRIALDPADVAARVRTQQSPDPDFDIVDRDGTALAFSVRRLSLDAYPRALWRAHTPERMARRLAELLGDVLPEEEVIRRTISTDASLADGGWIQAPLDELALSAEQASRVEDWAARGVWSTSDEEPVPLSGFLVLPVTEPDGRVGERWALAWRPLLVLSEETRTRQAHGETVSALAWTNELLKGLSRAIRGEVTQGSTRSERDKEAARDEEQLWRALLPGGGYARLLDDVPLERAWDLSQLLESEAIKPHQLQLVPGVERLQPQRADVGGEALELLGSWNFVGESRAVELAERRLGRPRPTADEALAFPEAALEFEALTRELLAGRHPSSGLELAAERLLARPEWADLASEHAVYRFAEFHSARPPRGARRYYVEAAPSSDPPRAVTTLDLDLQRFVRRVLEDVRAEHDPAVAMAIVVDVESGDVLAVDGVAKCDVKAFLPTWHLFTPGSTLKAIVMAIALDEHVVQPGDTFDAHYGTWTVPGSTRLIREAEGEKKGFVTAAEGLAFSLNVVLAQIGLLVDQAVFRERLTELGYATAPGAGLGTERAGYVPALPWKRAYTHASLGFGHELQVSLWQHAAALATLLRGGDYRPLRLFCAVEQGNRRWQLPLPEGRPHVFSREACIAVRDMMYMGAREGTGRNLFDPTLTMGTKTGTAEKVSAEVCLHVEFEHNELARGLSGHSCGKACRRQLLAQGREHRMSCYTSSICAFARIPGDDRERMVLLVVDEPRGKEKYGSRVAGPAAMRILQEALGRTVQGVPVAERLSLEATEVSYSDLNELDAPWAEEDPPLVGALEGGPER